MLKINLFPPEAMRFEHIPQKPMSKKWCVIGRQIGMAVAKILGAEEMT